ncbi:MAG: radical SAM protein [Betaproteobacteria bacterium SG8_39]|nr:MAG: radical SAM protein [Betaproteobacteria bacterium SG8_39]
MADWTALIGEVEALEAAQFDPALVARLAQAPPRDRGIHFYTPTFKSYATSEISACAHSAWPAVSITGAACQLQCDHCKAKVLAPMLPATTPEALWRVVNERIEAGAKGMLLTGGSNHRDEVEYEPFLPTVQRIKQRHPGFRIAVHTALLDRDRARAIEAAGVDAAMLDVIGAQDTVSQVYHLRRPVADFERALEALVDTSMKVVPHIVVGLHYGRMLGEWAALEMIARHTPSALVLVVAMPFYAPARRPFAVPGSATVGRFFLDARRALPDVPLLLGCARPAGRAKLEIDAYAVLAGLSGVAHPADGIVELALRLGRDVKVTPACCSIAVGEEVLALEDPAAPRIDPALIVANERRRRGRLANIAIVAG